MKPLERRDANHLDSVTPDHIHRKSAVALLVILTLGLALRVWGIGWGLPNGQRRSVSYHPDENTYLHLIATANPAQGDFIIDLKGQALVNYTLAALLVGADAVGWFELQASEDFYITHPEQATRMYLMGRAISLVSGMLSIGLIYVFLRRAFAKSPWWLAPLGALFLAVAPGHVLNSHFLETDVPVTFFVLLTLYLLMGPVRSGRLRDYCLVGISTGLAIGTKWSALPLLPLLLVAHCMRQPEWWRPQIFIGKEHLKRLLVMGLSLAFAFFLTNPYVALHPVDSIQHVDRVSASFFPDVGTSSFVTRLVEILVDTMPTSLGWGVYCLGLLGVILVLVDRCRKPVEVLLLLWILIFGAIAANASKPTGGRLLPLTASLAILAISAVARLWAWAVGFRWKLVTLAAWLTLSVCLALGMSVVVDLFFCCADTTRQDASHWIEANVPRGATFGLYLQEPYWDDPDILYQDFYHPGTFGARYQYTIYLLDPDTIPTPPPDCLIFTNRDERKIQAVLEPAEMDALLDWMEEKYQVAAEFESVVSIAGLEFRGTRWFFATPHIQILKLEESR